MERNSYPIFKLNECTDKLGDGSSVFKLWCYFRISENGKGRQRHLQDRLCYTSRTIPLHKIAVWIKESPRSVSEGNERHLSTRKIAVCHYVCQWHCCFLQITTATLSAHRKSTETAKLCRHNREFENLSFFASVLIISDILLPQAYCR